MGVFYIFSKCLTGYGITDPHQYKSGIRIRNSASASNRSGSATRFFKTVFVMYAFLCFSFGVILRHYRNRNGKVLACLLPFGNILEYIWKMHNEDILWKMMEFLQKRMLGFYIPILSKIFFDHLFSILIPISIKKPYSCLGNSVASGSNPALLHSE